MPKKNIDIGPGDNAPCVEPTFPHLPKDIPPQKEPSQKEPPQKDLSRRDPIENPPPNREPNEDIPFEEVIPEDSPPRKNIPEEPTIKDRSGRRVPVKETAPSDGDEQPPPK